MATTTDDNELDAFWDIARDHADLAGVPSYTGENPVRMLRPPAWAFGATPEQADELLDLVLTGTKTATASSYADYAREDEELPAPGTLGIVLDGAGHPRALVRTVEVRVVPFDQVDAEHARDEGEGDRSLNHWRAVHERFFTEHAGGGFQPDMPVVLERFRVLYPPT
ncbi:MAG TPA: ASCH domain-containing protein [Segeticoccus sp.]|nr:ASCH domain-containing protein [Segeticoccus sp.]